MLENWRSYSSAIALFNGKLNLISDKEDLDSYLELLLLKQQLDSMEEPALNSAQEQELLNMAYSPLAYTSSIATELLIAYGNEAYLEPLEYPRNVKVRRASAPLLEEKQEWCKLFPNPADDVVTLQLIEAPLTTEATFEVYSTTGQLVITGNLQQRNWLYNLDIRDLQPGVYILRITDMGQPMYNATLVVE